MSAIRPERVAELLHREVTQILGRDLSDPRFADVTVTDCEVSPDLKHAKVFYTRFDEARDAAEVQAGLDGAARFLRGLVGRSLELRVAPELVFRPDEQLAAGTRLSSLIDSAVAHDVETHVDDPAEPSPPESQGAPKD